MPTPPPWRSWTIRRLYPRRGAGPVHPSTVPIALVGILSLVLVVVMLGVLLLNPRPSHGGTTTNSPQNTGLVGGSQPPTATTAATTPSSSGGGGGHPTPTVTPAPTSTPPPPVAPPSGPTSPIALGAYVDASPGDVQVLDDFQQLISRDLAVVLWYQAWSDPYGKAFDPNLLDTVVARGAVPLITWEPWIYGAGASQPAYALSAIAKGTYDDYIHTWARGAAAWGRPFYLRFAHEMNGTWYPWGVAVNGNTPADYVAAWRHVLDIFRADGATNVRWVWSPNVLLAPATSYRSYYPGDDYVDWVALDGYNWGGAGWQSLSEVFARSYDALVALTEKPVMIAEVGCAEQGGDKAAWIESGLLTEIPQRLPRVRAVVWFNVNQEQDWRIDSSPAALQAFRMVALSALYAGKLEAVPKHQRDNIAWLHGQDSTLR